MKENDPLRIRLEETKSTNLYAKERRGERKNLLITAKRQSGGMGTKGRSFFSNEGGVYLTRLQFYEGFPAERAFEIMISGAVAVCETLREYSLTPVVKWPNDVFVNGKKICGILIENTLTRGEISSSILGIGLNVCNPLPDELKEIATTMRAEGVSAEVEEVTERLIAKLSTPYGIAQYRSYLGFVGQEVLLTVKEEKIPARLLSVDGRGNLEVEISGEKKSFSFGEVSITC